MRLMTVMGDSMEPTLFDGDLVLVDLSRKDLAQEGIFAVRIYDGLAVKRLQRAGKARVRWGCRRSWHKSCPNFPEREGTAHHFYALLHFYQEIYKKSILLCE